ncbi:MAG: hypothetical protein HY868_23080 [Chloroflexi bacterium]|nr:hypothetical protein [Chloroflexota bacterium]
MPTILFSIPDLMFSTRVEDAAKRLGYRVVALNVGDAVETVIARESPALVIVALDAPDWARIVASAKQGGARVLAFGSHKNVEQMQAAKRAGCDQVIARSMMAAELPNLLRKFVEG